MSDRDGKLPRWKQAAGLLLLALPALWTGRLVQLYGVDIPWWDQWDGFCPLLEKAAAGTLRPADFFAFHNEHRILFPRLLMFGLARLTRWNVRVEMLVIWLLAVLCAANLWRLTRVTGWRRSGTTGALLFAANLLLFTPLGLENWLWGFQIPFLMIPACITACLWLAPTARFPLDFILTFGLSTICTFSGAGGFVGWILAAPLLLLKKADARSRRPWWLLWAAGFLVCLVLYFHGYRRPVGHPGLLEALAHPVPTIRYFLAYLGGAFAYVGIPNQVLVAQGAGAVLLAGLALVAIHLWRRRRDAGLPARALPWLLLTLYALFNAAITAAGRQGFGVEQALASRYLISSVMLPIGLLFLVPLLFDSGRARRPGGAIPVGALAAVLFLLHGLGSLHSLELWKLAWHSRLTTKALVLSVNVVEEPEELGRFVHAVVPPLKGRIDLLARLGYLRPGPLRSRSIREIAGGPAPDPRRYGEIQQAGEPGEGQIGMSGWSILPDGNRAADAVLLTCDAAGGDPVIFGLAVVDRPPTGEAAAGPAAGYRQAGWFKVFDTARLPAGPRVLRAWAFDAEAGRAWPMQGLVTSQP